MKLTTAPALIPALLLLTFAALAGCADKRTPDQQVEAALASIEKSRYRDAIIEMRNLLRQRPDYAPARLALGRALIAVGDMSAAEKELERARQLGAEPRDFLEPLTRAWQSRGNHHEVLAEIRPESINDPALTSVLNALRGRSMLALGSVNRAAETFALELDAELSVEAQRISLIGEAEIAGQNGDTDTALTRLEEALEIAPGSPETILALGRVYLTREEYDDAIALLGKARDSNMQARRQDWFFIEAQLAEAYIGLGDLVQARAATDTLLEIGKTHPMAAYLRGRVELDSGNINESIQYLQQVIADYPSYAPALTLLGVALIELDDFDQAEMHLSQSVASDPGNVRTRRLLAETRMRMGRSRAAVATLQAGLRNDSADSDMMALLGRESLRLGERDDGLRYLREALAEDPNNLRANLALAQAYLSDGEIDAAVGVLNALPGSVISADRRALLIRIARIDRTDSVAATAQIESLLADTPDDPFIMSLAGSFFSTLGNSDRARALFNRVLYLMPDNRSAMLSLLDIDERTGDYTRSRALFERANAESPDDLLPLLVLARIDSASGDDAAALARVQEALEKHPSALLPNLILGAQAMRDGNLTRADELAAIAVDRYPKSSRAQALVGLIRMRQSRIDEAAASFRRAVLYEPTDAEYRYYLGQANLGNQRNRQARTDFKDALARDPSHLGALRAMGVLDAEDGRNVQAEQWVEQIRERYGEQWIGTIAIADIRALQGRADEAVTLYEQAQAEELSWPISLELYRLRRANDMPDATRSLEFWTEREPEHVPGLLTLAQAQQRSGQTEMAIDKYERILALDQDNPLAANNLAWLYLERNNDGDPAKALSAARTAYNASPANIDIADTFGWMLFKNGERDIARDVFDSAMGSTNAEESPDLAYHFAAMLFADGRRAQARALLDGALRTTRTFASRSEAQALRNQL